MHFGPACIREEQLWSSEAKCHPEEVSEAPRPIDVHTVKTLLGVGVGVEAHSAKKTRQTKQMISMQVGDENLSDSTLEENMTYYY